MNLYQILCLIICFLCLFSIYTMDKISKLQQTIKKILINKNKEIDKLEKQVEMLSNQYLNLREDKLNQDKIIKALEDELFRKDVEFEKEWNKKYGE